MAACDLAIPEELYWSTLEDDNDYKDRGPSNRESGKTVHGESYPSVGEDTNVEKENGQKDEADGRAPCKLLDKNTLLHGKG